MALQVIEGTWEEIERHKAELIGHHLRVIISPEGQIFQEKISASNKSIAATPKVLRGRGAFKGMFGGIEGILREKQIEIALEERIF